jgi:hypothetical protein
MSLDRGFGPPDHLRDRMATQLVSLHSAVASASGQVGLVPRLLDLALSRRVRVTVESGNVTGAPSAQQNVN